MNSISGRSGSPCYRHSPALRYDPENRLTQVGSNWTYDYTGDGLRAWKSTNGVPTFLYSDGGVPVLETDSSANMLTVNTYGRMACSLTTRARARSTTPSTPWAPSSSASTARAE